MMWKVDLSSFIFLIICSFINEVCKRSNRKEWNQRLIDQWIDVYTEWNSIFSLNKKSQINYGMFLVNFISLLLIVISLVLCERNSMQWWWSIELLVRTIERLPDWISFLHTTMVVTLYFFESFVFYRLVTSTILLRRTYFILLARLIWFSITTICLNSTLF